MQNVIVSGRLFPALCLVLSGCASVPEAVSELPRPGFLVELAETPFFPQERYQCGPAALATVLGSSGIDVHPDDLVASVYLPGREGSLQVEMLATTRRFGRIPYPLDGTLSAIAAELEAGRPVLVLQNLGVSMIPRWHYAVVVGIDSRRNMVVLRSGKDERRETPIKLFLRTWSRGDFWAFSVLRPGQLPATGDPGRYLAAVAAVEEVGMLDAALQAWHAALQQWPGNPVAQFGFANTNLALGRAEEAAQTYRTLLAANPELVVARNNLAIALQQLGRFEEALREIERAIQEADEPALRDELLDTKLGITTAIAE